MDVSRQTENKRMQEKVILSYRGSKREVNLMLFILSFFSTFQNKRNTYPILQKKETAKIQK